MILSPIRIFIFDRTSLIIKIKIKQELRVGLDHLRHFDSTINFPITAQRSNNISVIVYTPYTRKRSKRATPVSETCRSHPLFERLSPRGEARECTLPGEIFSSPRLKFIGETTTTTTLSPFHAESGFLVIFARREEGGGGGETLAALQRVALIRVSRDFARANKCTRQIRF